MNVIDIFLILILLLNISSGFQKGFITGMLQLFMLAAGLLTAFFLYPFFASILDKVIPSLGMWRVPLSFIIALVVARIIFSFIANFLLSSIPESSHENTVNRIMGIVPGAFNGLVWAFIVAALLLSVPFSERLSALSENSKLANKMYDKVDWLDEKLSPLLNEIVNKPFGKIRINPESEELIALPFKDANPKIREDLEAKMLVLVNKERQKAGLPILKPDVEMLAVAREHSKDMFARGYFSHVTPEGLSPFDRMKEAHIKYLAAGENLALGQTLSICHRGLMNSPGHRKNILNPLFRRVGIGIVDGGIYGLMITQNFRN
ncbi:CvpA family protein [Segetibacter koreensis]|uniref:CvpA family protein n=1 Tax=Segetibacter koreensis TaxID=398037 RepID=UPI0003633DE0|nr:CvpA family protein [Segetibacter koreensis]